MRLHHVTLVLLAGLSMAGCATSRGKNAETPSQVSLSLYAAPNVNPNPDALSPDTAQPVMQTPEMAAVTVDTHAKEGPYLVNLSGGSKAELAEKMKALLDYLQEPGSEKGEQAPLQISSAPGSTSVAQVASASDGNDEPSIVPAIVTRSSELAPYAFGAVGGFGIGFHAASPIIPFAAGQKPPATADGLPVPLRTGDDSSSADAQNAKAPALGQYADSPALTSLVQATPDNRSIATPVSFKILQLKDDSVFLNADHDLLLKDLKKALGSTYVEDDDYVLQPGQFKFVDFAKIDKNARYIAVLANFHDQRGAGWKQVMRIEAGGFKYSLLVVFQDIEVGLVDESYHQPTRKK
ncbi:type VI secretion system lipoprotein TssJ [Dyella kyungheensis]|uniref:Type VI secretion system lipoprotein TssJ n=1 Tax=Dyella kyungheensis TaxID=1242174 RepID=A0ABS2JWC5_9GAMM|nr:type VI secretion system lipoprotein TssJ [Dyella kyungheensis]MBM7123318.1 type VI secretion system lipoprotein TssJ [Dyella kyungheensis]